MKRSKGGDSMKRLIAFFLIISCILCLAGCSKAVGEEGLIAKARKEINNAEADTIEMVIG